MFLFSKMNMFCLHWLLAVYLWHFSTFSICVQAFLTFKADPSISSALIANTYHQLSPSSANAIVNPSSPSFSSSDEFDDVTNRQLEEQNYLLTQSQLMSDKLHFIAEEQLQSTRLQNHLDQLAANQQTSNSLPRDANHFVYHRIDLAAKKIKLCKHLKQLATLGKFWISKLQIQLAFHLIRVDVNCQIKSSS